MAPTAEQKLIDAVCGVLEKRSMTTKDLVAELASAKILITKKELNQLLYRRLPQITGLSVENFVWSFSKGPTVIAKAIRSRAAHRLPASAAPTVKAAVIVPPRTLDFDPDPEQAAIIGLAPSARVIVEAGPGTGKTAVACKRIARLLLEEDVNPANVLVISFTRTAVAEFRQRIAHYVTRASASQVQISTIDSSAWQLDLVYGGGAKGLESFDETIESVLALLRARDASLRDFLSGLEHVVVDEAQDVTGIRSDFVVELVRSLPKECGVTIFADPLQSIYGFTLNADADEPDHKEAIDAQPLEKLTANLSSFERKRLLQPHRFSDDLAGVLAGTRDIVGSRELDGLTKQRRMAEAIASAAEELPRDLRPICDLVRDQSSTLLLFRHRREVVQASSFLCSSGISHRLRMPQLPDFIQPWIARVFWDYTDSVIDRSAFELLYTSRCTPTREYEPTVDAAWNMLRRLAPETRERVKMARVRAVLARARPPIDACYLDTGPVGPTLGTIHASKGREAESVYVFIPPTTTAGDVEEESRVLYVAATRARSRLLATTAFQAHGKRLNRHGRCFRLEKVKQGGSASARIEVGVAGDLHAAMSVSTRLHTSLAQAVAAQDVLWGNRDALTALRAKRTDRGHEYRLSLRDDNDDNDNDEDERDLLGALSRRVFDDAKTISAFVSSSALPAWDLYFLYFAGARTYVANADDSAELDHAYEPYRTTGFFLVPQVRGFCRFYINNIGKKK